MLRQQREKQQKMNLVIMEQLVPEDHFLRKVDRAVDFSFIYELCAPLYCADNGRPAIDPEILFRMLLVGYLYAWNQEYARTMLPDRRCSKHQEAGCLVIVCPLLHQTLHPLLNAGFVSDLRAVAPGKCNSPVFSIRFPRPSPRRPPRAGPPGRVAGAPASASAPAYRHPFSWRPGSGRDSRCRRKSRWPG